MPLSGYTQKLLFACWLVAVCPLGALAGESMVLATIPESGVTVSITGWAGISPNNTSGRDAGFLPLVLTITNGSPTDRLWTVQPARGFGFGNGVVPTTRLAVPAGGEGSTTLYVDPGPSDTSGGVWLSVRGFGLAGGEQQFRVEPFRPAILSASSGSGASPQPIFPSAISRVAFAKRGQTLENYMNFISGGLDLAAAPDDWRGWSIFSCLLFEESEWIGMSAGQRKALLEWVGLGGRAGLLVTDAAAERLDRIGLPSADPDGRRRVGAGEIVPMPWDGVELDSAVLDRFLDRQTVHPKTDQLAGYSFRNASNGGELTWAGGFGQLFNVFGSRQLPVVAILAFLAIFGIVAGPLNLLLFAGPGRRARMFWTTPLISLSATVVLLGLIFFRDGVGGAGARRVLCLLMPEQNAMAVIQEQFSRTGVLLGGSFPIGEPSWMRPLHDIPRGDGLLEVDGLQRQGDWFSSRADQGYLLETVRPSRASVEFVDDGDGPPAVISGIEVPLDRLFVIDNDGGVWTTTDVGTGERKILEQSDKQAYAEWFRRLTADAGPARAAALEAVRDRRGHAYAEAGNAAAVAVATLGSLRWIDDKAVFVGPFTRTTAP